MLLLDARVSISTSHTSDKSVGGYLQSTLCKLLTYLLTHSLGSWKYWQRTMIVSWRTMSFIIRRCCLPRFPALRYPNKETCCRQEIVCMLARYNPIHHRLPTSRHQVYYCTSTALKMWAEVIGYESVTACSNCRLLLIRTQWLQLTFFIYSFWNHGTPRETVTFTSINMQTEWFSCLRYM